jgi:hypothetical protein
MDLGGIDAAFPYPGLGLLTGAVQDPYLSVSICRAYNRRLADYCRPYPGRLFGVAMPPMQSVDLAVSELRYGRQELGMQAGFLRPNPYQGRMLHYPTTPMSWARPSTVRLDAIFRFKRPTGRHMVASEPRVAQHSLHGMTLIAPRCGRVDACITARPGR